LLVSGVTAWGALALLYSSTTNALASAVLAGAFLLCGLLTALAVGARRRARAAVTGFALLFAVLLGWWSGIEPANDRDWQPDVARLAHAEINGDLVTVRNVRNFAYRSETDYTPHYYDRTYDLGKLRSVDLIAVYWMGPAIAHTILSFGFEGGEQLAISIETRKERGETYSTTRGFFKQYELHYVVADERDVVRLRTSYRKDPPEDVYVYRLHGPLENGRRVFLQYMQRINDLQAKPEFYNTLIDNCTTGIWMNAHQPGARAAVVEDLRQRLPAGVPSWCRPAGAGCAIRRTATPGGYKSARTGGRRCGGFLPPDPCRLARAVSGCAPGAVLPRPAID
jgi:hypothetical protein